MKATSIASPPGGGKQIVVELEDSDMINSRQSEDEWHSLNVLDRYRKMSDLADILVVDHMRRRGDISEEFAGQRINEIKNGLQ